MAHLPAWMAPESGECGSHRCETYLRLALPAGILVKVGASITGTRVDSLLQPSLGLLRPRRLGALGRPACCIRPARRGFNGDRVAPACGVGDRRCEGGVSVLGVPRVDVLGRQVAHLDVTTGGDEATRYVALTLDGGR